MMKLHEPNFENLCKVLRREKTDTPVLFDFSMNSSMIRRGSGEKGGFPDLLSRAKASVKAFANFGYDYATVHASDFSFPTNEQAQKSSKSLNDGFVITDRESFEKYVWPDPNDSDFSVLEKIKPYLPDGMKLMVMGPGGVLENVIDLVGYDNLCYMLIDEPELVKEIFDHVGERLLVYYERALEYDTVGVISSNDDWGFNTQTFLSPADLREYVFPWHKKIVDLAHAAGRPILLHSCGKMTEVIDDIVALGFDAKHSYEDNIMPIEEAYEAWHDRIALLGGIDMNFLCRKTPEEVYARTSAMVERTKERGGWAVGTGNSLPDYVPVPQYGAMLKAALGYDPFEERGL